MKESRWAIACFALLGCSGSTAGTGLNEDGGSEQGGMFGIAANKDAGATPATTSTAQAGSSTCDACVNRSCSAEVRACTNNPDCAGLYGCLSKCGADDSSCIDACVSQYPNGRSDLSTALSCVDQSCAKECQ